MSTTDELLKEILAKLNVLMSYTYLSEESTVMDVYEDLMEQYKKTKEIKVEKENEVRLDIAERNMYPELIQYAFTTGHYSVVDGNMIIEKDGKRYSIAMGEII